MPANPTCIRITGPIFPACSTSSPALSCLRWFGPSGCCCGSAGFRRGTIQSGLRRAWHFIASWATFRGSLPSGSSGTIRPSTWTDTWPWQSAQGVERARSGCGVTLDYRADSAKEVENLLATKYEGQRLTPWRKEKSPMRHMGTHRRGGTPVRRESPRSGGGGCQFRLLLEVIARGAFKERAQL